MSRRYVFDTGALIGAERRKQRALDFLALVAAGRAQLVTPVICVVEWWTGRTDAREKLLASITVAPLSLAAAQAAGQALASLGKSIDAAVAAHASLSGAPVITSDPSDFESLRRFFPALLLLAV